MNSQVAYSSVRIQVVKVEQTDSQSEGLVCGNRVVNLGPSADEGDVTNESRRDGDP